MKTNKIVKNSIIFSIFSFLVNGINFILIPLFTKYLSVEEYGIVASVTLSITFFTAFFTFGLNGAFSRIYFEIDDPNEKLSLLNTSFLTNIILAAVITSTILFTNGLFLDHVFKSIKYEPLIKYSIFISFFNIFSIAQLSYLLVKGEALKYRILTSAYFILNTLFTIVNLSVFKMGIIGILKSQIYSNLILSIYYVLTTVKVSNKLFNVKYSIKLLFFGIPIMFYTIFGMLLDQSSKYFVERYLSLKDLGIYNLAYQFSSIITLINSAINMAWVPIYFEESKVDENSEKFRTFSKYIFQIVSLIALCISVYHKYILKIFINKNYENATIFIPIFVYIFVLSHTYWFLFINPIFQAKKTKYLPFIALISGLASIVICILFIPRFGIYGAIFSVLFGYLIMNLCGFLVVNKFLKLRYDHLKLFSIYILSLVFFLISIFLTNKSIFIEIFLKSLLVLIYLRVVFYFKFFDLNELKLLRRKK